MFSLISCIYICVCIALQLNKITDVTENTDLSRNNSGNENTMTKKYIFKLEK